MNRLKSALGFGWAAFAIIIVLVTFLASDPLSRTLASATGVTVSPWFSGGEIVRTIDHTDYKTLLHRPVFDGLLSERATGFVQVNWETVERLPFLIEEKVDFEGDGKYDFLITLDTVAGKAILTPHGPSVVSLDRVYKLKNGWAVRVLLRRS